MSVPKCYYRFRSIGIDFSSEREIKKYNQELVLFEDLSEQFEKLKSAYENKIKERADIMINMIPDVFGVVELSVYHHIRYKFFSHAVKKQCFSLCITKYDSANIMGLFFYEMTDIEEVKHIFKQFIEEHIIPDLSKWKYTHIG